MTSRLDEPPQPLSSTPPDGGDEASLPGSADDPQEPRLRAMPEANPRAAPEGNSPADDLLTHLDEAGEDSQDEEDVHTNQLRMLPKLTTDIQPWRVIFQTLTPDPKVMGVDVQDVSVVGRSDPTVNIVPDLDLAEFGGQSLGVSRRHAILLPTDEGLCLLDLDSTNGTWINGVYLQPGQKYRLRTGDRVEFGRLRMVVRVVGTKLEGKDDSASSTAITRPKPKRD